MEGSQSEGASHSAAEAANPSPEGRSEIEMAAFPPADPRDQRGDLQGDGRAARPVEAATGPLSEPGVRAATRHREEAELSADASARSEATEVAREESAPPESTRADHHSPQC